MPAPAIWLHMIMIYLLFLPAHLLLVQRSEAGPVDPGLGEGAIQPGQALGQGVGGGGSLGVERPGYLGTEVLELCV